MSTRLLRPSFIKGEAYLVKDTAAEKKFYITM